MLLLLVIVHLKHSLLRDCSIYSVTVTTTMSSSLSASSSIPTGSKTDFDEVPYFVLNLSDGKAKALFTVPTHLSESLIVHPVMCRGACFGLKIDVVSQSSTSKSSKSPTSFLSTEFYSPDPEQTAKQISQRIAIRMGGPSPVLSQFLFGGR